MTFPHKIKPLFFAKFLKSLYNEWMDINEANCIDYYRVVDYLQDDKSLDRIVNFISQNITFENSIDLLQLTNKFDESIEQFYGKNNINGQEMSDHINYIIKVNTAEPATFIKIIQNLRKRSSSSICANILKVYLSNHEISSCTQIPVSIYKDIFSSDSNESKLENNDKALQVAITDTELLCHAMLDDSEASIKLLRKYCHDKNRNNDMKNAKIIKALSQVSGIKTRIEAKQVGTTYPDGLEIIDVCENGQIETLKALLECGTDIDVSEWGGPIDNKVRQIYKKGGLYYQDYWPLAMACYSKQKEIVKLLLSRKCNLDQTW